MIADRTCRAVSFLAARVESRLRCAAPTGHKARRALAHRAFRLRGAVNGRLLAARRRTYSRRSRLLGRRQRRIEPGRIPDELIRHRGRDRVRARAWLRAALVHGGASGGHIRRRQ